VSEERGQAPLPNLPINVAWMIQVKMSHGQEGGLAPAPSALPAALFCFATRYKMQAFLFAFYIFNFAL
jgi:hypothetical protein